MKSILISDDLHVRLKDYTDKKGLRIGKLVEYCIEEHLRPYELSMNSEYQELQKRLLIILNKVKENDDFMNSEEYKQFVIDNDTFYKKLEN
jgi:hypothetical protein